MSYLITKEGRECTECNKFKVWELYYIQKDSKTGRTSKCIDCKKAAQMESRDPSMRVEVANDIALNWDMVTRHLKYGLLA